MRENRKVTEITAVRFCFSCKAYFFSKYSPALIPGYTENINIGTVITRTITISWSIIVTLFKFFFIFVIISLIN